MFSTNCQYHKLTIFCVFEAKSLWQQFGHPVNNLHMLWRSAAKYLRTILLSYCATRQNPSDWEEAFGVCSPELKTERYDKEIKNRCLPQCDAEHTWGGCLAGGESRLFFPLWCGRLPVSMAGMVEEALLRALWRPAHPGNHQSNQKSNRKQRTRLAYSRSNMLHSIITWWTEQRAAWSNNMFDDMSSYQYVLEAVLSHESFWNVHNKKSKVLGEYFSL